MIVSLEQAIAHLRADAGVEDEQVTLYLSAAIEQAQEYLNRKVYEDAAAMAAAVLAGEAGDDPMLANDSIRAAVLLICGHLYAHREDVGPTTLGELPMGSRELLRPFRVGWGV